MSAEVREGREHFRSLECLLAMTVTSFHFVVLNPEGVEGIICSAFEGRDGDGT